MRVGIDQIDKKEKEEISSGSRQIRVIEVRGAICEQQGVECGCRTGCQVGEQQAGGQRSHSRNLVVKGCVCHDLVDKSRRFCGSCGNVLPWLPIFNCITYLRYSH